MVVGGGEAERKAVVSGPEAVTRENQSSSESGHWSGCERKVVAQEAGDFFMARRETVVFFGQFAGASNPLVSVT